MLFDSDIKVLCLSKHLLCEEKITSLTIDGFTEFNKRGSVILVKKLTLIFQKIKEKNVLRYVLYSLMILRYCLFVQFYEKYRPITKKVINKFNIFCQFWNIQFCWHFQKNI